MIKKFGVITRTGEILGSILGPNRNMYNNTEDKASLEVFNEKGNGIYWKIDEKEITIFPNIGNIVGYPCTDLNTVIAIFFPINNSQYPAPQNAVLYSQTGEVMKLLTTPKLVSAIGMEMEKKNSNLFKWFENISWSIISDTTIITSIQIGFGKDYFEERVYNSLTGEFEDCLKFGKI